MLIAAMLVGSSRISKLQGLVRLSISSTQERLSKLKKRSRPLRRFSVSDTSTSPLKIHYTSRNSLTSLIHTETCQRCGYMSSNVLCKACTLLEGLERGRADAGIVSLCFRFPSSVYDNPCSYRQIEHGRNLIQKVHPQTIYGQYLISSHPQATQQ